MTGRPLCKLLCYIRFFWQQVPVVTVFYECGLWFFVVHYLRLALMLLRCEANVALPIDLKLRKDSIRRTGIDILRNQPVELSYFLKG